MNLLWSILTCAMWRVTVLDDTDNPQQGADTGKLRNILATLAAAPTVAHIDEAGFRLHSLSGRMKGLWAVTVLPTGG